LRSRHLYFSRISTSPSSTAHGARPTEPNNVSSIPAIDADAREASPQVPSTALSKQLGFTDLIFASVLLVVIPDFFGVAVKAGPASVFLWLLAIAFFFLPQALVVSHLNRKLPLEGGLYEWARLAFGDLIGFLVAWNLWL